MGISNHAMQGHSSYTDRNVKKSSEEEMAERRRVHTGIQAMNARVRKERRLAKLAEQNHKLAQDEAAEVGEKANIQKKEAPATEAKPSGASRLASIFGTAGTATGNPYLVAASMGAKVLGRREDRKREVEKYNLDQQNKRIARVVTAMSRIGEGIGSMGMA